MEHTKTPQEQLNDDAFYQQESIITNLKAQNSDLLEALKEWRLAFNERVQMKPEKEHLDWFVKLARSSNELIESVK